MTEPAEGKSCRCIDMKEKRSVKHEFTDLFAYQERHEMNRKRKSFYAGGDVACNVVFGMVGTLLTLFYTDYVGVAAASVGLIMLLSRFFDGFSDMIMGIIVEKTNSKWGKSRPWILWMSVPYALSAILLFTVPHTMGVVQSIYIFVTYNFCTTVCYTAINLPYGSLSAMMTRVSSERDMLSVVRMGLSPLGKIIAVTCTTPLVKLFGNDHDCMGSHRPDLTSDLFYQL